jgi:UDP-2-acetamido-3-amino-2,3-dideoxy-glucuronate N-acetyltransferase
MADKDTTARNIAVVGSGYWGKNLVRNFAELGALHTVCDTDPAVTGKVKEQYPDLNICSDYRRVLQDDAVKGVVIAAPAVLHHPMAKAALQAGKDVFVEKPLALRIEQGRELVELAEKHNRILMVGHLLEYHPAVLKLQDMVNRGELGKIEYLYSNRLNLGKLRTEENVLWSFAPHDISVMLLLTGEMPQEVAAQGGYYLHRDIADVTMTTFSFKSGIRAHIFVSWLHPYKEQRLVVVGDKKMAVFNDTEPKDKLLIYDHEIEWIEHRPVPHQKQSLAVEIDRQEPLKLECQDFIDSMQSRRKPHVDGRKGLQVLEVLSYCQQSLERGGRAVACGGEEKDYFAHETSLVEGPVQIGKGTKIWHFAHVMPDAKIGDRCNIGQNVYIGKGVTMGNNVKVQNNVSVYEGVVLEDDVFCGPSCVFTNVFNPRSHVSRKHEYRPTVVRRGASIGANATIICGNTIGRYAFIGAGAVVTKDVPDHAMYYGNPARRNGWVCNCGAKLDFSHSESADCPSCGRRYTKQGTKKDEKVTEAKA